MADSEDFLLMARVIERSTSLSELQSRGLVRRLLKQAGLDAQDVSAQQLAAVGQTLLGAALQKNGVADSEPVVKLWLDSCTRQAERAKANPAGRVSNTVEEVFARMGLRR